MTVSERRITLRYLDGCPNWDVAKTRVEGALKQLGETTPLDLEQVESLQQADELDFRGSPTILINGHDLFEATGHPGLSCRVYRTDAGLEGAPSVDQVVAALKETR